MSEPAWSGNESLSLTVAQRVDAACSRFEKIWKAAGGAERPPCIEEFLGDFSEPERSALLRELIPLDAHYRAQNGATPHAEEYHARFPMLQLPWITRAMAVGSSQQSPGPMVPERRVSGARYRVLRPHAKGGLGEVFVAEDNELHRTVALKEIQADHADNPESRDRFLLEAEVTGGLEHPGIVPVYGLGVYPDGRPFYAMRFIRGNTVKEAINEFHGADVPGRDPGERGLALRQLLRRFVDVCNAVAYAHSRGILHRDLKPANVMLGQFGETLVVDWGLAKPFEGSQTDAPPEKNLIPFEHAARGTRMGVTIGTPAYMSPEQAMGRQDLLGPASDVYSLGATLYHLLTGKAAFRGRDVRQVLRQVQEGDFPMPRRVNRRIPVGLEAVCLKAMRRERGERYASALALATDVERWLADEPVAARREPWWERTFRFCRQRPVLAGWLGFGLAENLALLVVVGGFILWSYGVVIQPLWLNGLVFAPFLGFVWLLAMIVTMSLLAPWLGLLGSAIGFTLTNYWTMATRKGGRNRAIRAGVLGGKMGMIAAAIAGYMLSLYQLIRVFDANAEQHSVLMWSAMGTWIGLPLLGIGLGAVRKARSETRWKRIRWGAVGGVLLGTVCGFTLAYLNGLQLVSDSVRGGLAGLALKSKESVPPRPANARARPPVSSVLPRGTPPSFPMLDAPKDDFWTKMTAEYEEKVRRNPNDRNQVVQLGSHYLMLAQMAKDRRRPQEEIDWYDKAIGTLEKGRDRELLITSYPKRAAALTRAGRLRDALKDWDRALEINTWPDHHEIRLQRALTLARLGDHAQAVAEADGFHPDNKLPGPALETFARVYAVAAKAGAGQEMSRKYAERALAMIVLAKKASAPIKVERLRQDADFEALRGTDEFNKVLRER
jgi:serine/threonine protein kinase/tetratricopeptide (TPR) repeat protein